jgi:adenylyl cyclase-associated protein
MSSGEALEPLQKLLESLQVRLAAVESHVGIQVQERPSSVHKRVSSTSSSYSGVFQKAVEEEPKLEKEKEKEEEETLSRSLIAFDTLVASSLLPLLDSLTALTLTELSAPLSEIWKTQRVIIQMASSCKKPSGMTLTEALQSYLIPIQNSMKTIQTLFATDKKYRSFDIHGKAIQELLVGVSWLVMQPPPAPSSHVKETLSSTDFWTNKIRKEFKALASSSDADVLAKKQMAFCDSIKKLILEMATYVKEYHLSGLCWNPNGVAMQDYVAPTPHTHSNNKSIQEQKADQPKPVEASSTSSVTTTSQGNWIKELESKKSLDGNSAATGLRKVTKDQQTWRKEYVAPTATSTTSSASATQMQLESSSSSPLAHSTTSTQKSGSTSTKAGGKNGKEGLSPICEYQASGNKWVIENQNSSNNPNGLCNIEVEDAKTQAYMYVVLNGFYMTYSLTLNCVSHLCIPCISIDSIAIK